MSRDAKRLLRVLRVDVGQTANQLYQSLSGDKPSIKTLRRWLEAMEREDEGVRSDRSKKPYQWMRVVRPRAIATDGMPLAQAALLLVAEVHLSAEAPTELVEAFQELRTAAGRRVQTAPSEDPILVWLRQNLSGLAGQMNEQHSPALHS
jgi:hypothetical protein